MAENDELIPDPSPGAAPRIAALGSGRRGWHRRDLERAAAAEGCALDWCRWRDLRAAVGGAGPRVDDVTGRLAAASAVIARTVPADTLERVVFRMDALARLEAAGVPVLNPPRAIETAVDKYLALARLEGAGLPVPETAVCERASAARDAFDRLGGDVVIKAIFGAEGFGMTRVTDPALAERAFALLERAGSAIYLQRFCPEAAEDLRVFVIDGRVAGAMRRAGDAWPPNTARGGHAARATPSAAAADLARRAARACGAAVAGVDLLRLADDSLVVLEVNAAPGWRALQSVTGVDVGRGVIRALLARIPRG